MYVLDRLVCDLTLYAIQLVYELVQHLYDDVLAAPLLGPGCAGLLAAVARAVGGRRRASATARGWLLPRGGCRAAAAAAAAAGPRPCVLADPGRGLVQQVAEGDVARHAPRARPERLRQQPRRVRQLLRGWRAGPSLLLLPLLLLADKVQHASHDVAYGQLCGATAAVWFGGGRRAGRRAGGCAPRPVARGLG
jgi:hypothetical protein